MSIDLNITQVNDVYLQIACNEGIARELSEDFSYTAKNWHHGKRKGWDGKLRLFDLRTYRIYAGLIDKLLRWAYAKNYTHNWRSWQSYRLNNDILVLLHRLYINLALPLKPREDQDMIIREAIRQDRGTIISPTGSGKSLLAYILTRYYNQKTLIIVPTINLVNQMANDFKDYGYDVEKNVHRIYDYGGLEKVTTKLVTISTWQSLVDLDPVFFQSFQTVIGDEAHGFKAKSMTNIMKQMIYTPYRFAMTATLANKDAQVDEMVIEGLFGPIIQGPSTQELIKDGHLAEIEIYCIVLQYPEEVRKKHRSNSYNEETDFLVAYEPRQAYIRNLAASLKGSTFVLFRLVEKHGKQLFDDIKALKGDDAHMVYGETDDEIREAVRITANRNKNATIVASYGVFSGGVNVPNLRNAIFASGYKSQIKVLQSIGRTIRKTDTKPLATIYDIVDDLSYKAHYNYGIKHYLERLKLYYQEFPDMKLRIITVPL